jgi:hypothetical protein
MSDETLLNEPVKSNEVADQPANQLGGKIIYQRNAEPTEKQPEFKPGNTPHTQYGDETLNGNVPWQSIVQEIQAHYTQEQLIEESGVKPVNLLNILKQDYSKLDFRTGARILGVHSRLFPEHY